MYKGLVLSGVGMMTRCVAAEMGMRQGSVFSPYLLDVSDVNDRTPWSALFADDVLFETSTKTVEHMLEQWRKLLEETVMKISRARSVELHFWKNQYVELRGELRVIRTVDTLKSLR